MDPVNKSNWLEMLHTDWVIILSLLLLPPLGLVLLWLNPAWTSRTKWYFTGVTAFALMGLMLGKREKPSRVAATGNPESRTPEPSASVSPTGETEKTMAAAVQASAEKEAQTPASVPDVTESQVSVDPDPPQRKAQEEGPLPFAGHKPKEEYEAAGRILVMQIKPGMSTQSVESLLGEPTTREQIDLSQFTGNGSSATPAMEIMQWKYGVPADNCFITLSFTSGRLKDGGTAGYNIHKGFTTREGKPLMQAVKEMGDKLDAEGGK